MKPSKPQARSPLTLVEPSPVRPLADFSDRDSQGVLRAAAEAVARELGRQAAREYFAELIGRSKIAA